MGRECHIPQRTAGTKVLNLSLNVLFGSEDGYNAAAKLLSKSMKKHPELSYVNLTSTGLGANDEALKLVLEGVKDINNFIMEDREGFTTMTNFLEKKKNSITAFSMDGMHLAEGDNAKANVKVLEQCLEKNTTLEQLSLASNKLGSNDRIFSTVMSGMKVNSSLVYVDLSSNEIRRMPTVKLLAKYLRNNSSLIGLDLRFNKLPTKSADVLVKALKKNTTLEDLCLANNNIGDKSVESFTDMLQKNSTLKSLDLQGNNLKVQTGRKGMFKALCDTTSLDAIANNSNHTCRIIIAGKNYGGTCEEELNKINALENEGEKIRYKVVLALCQMNKELYDPRTFDDIPLELMPRVLELIQLEIGCNGYGEGITKVITKKRSSKEGDHLSKLYDAIHQWPAFPSLFSRGPGKGCLTKTGKLKRKREKRVSKVTDEDWEPSGARKTKRRRWRWDYEENRWYQPEPEPLPPSRSSSRSTAAVSYADVENSEDES